MAFKRIEDPQHAPSDDALTAAMVGIGMNFAAPGDPEANIEDTLLFASSKAIDSHDLRVLAVLVTWFEVHHAWVNADRMIKLVEARGSTRVLALWNALATWQGNDRRYAKLSGGNRGTRVDVLPTGTEFQIKRHGEDARFAGTCLRVPANVLRDRPGDVVAPTELARRHRAYHHRILMGPSYRADLWAALEVDSTLSAADLARRTYASFASAWRVKRDFNVLVAST